MHQLLCWQSNSQSYKICIYEELPFFGLVFSNQLSMTNVGARTHNTKFKNLSVLLTAKKNLTQDSCLWIQMFKPFMVWIHESPNPFWKLPQGGSKREAFATRPWVAFREEEEWAQDNVAVIVVTTNYYHCRSTGKWCLTLDQWPRPLAMSSIHTSPPLSSIKYNRHKLNNPPNYWMQVPKLKNGNTNI